MIKERARHISIATHLPHFVLVVAEQAMVSFVLLLLVATGFGFHHL